MKTKQPDAVDVEVGHRIRIHRMARGMSQSHLGEKLGVTFQQVQKYEKGSNRIGASRLQQISLILQVPVSFFFEGAPAPPGGPSGLAEGASPEYVTNFLASSDGLKLVRAFTRVPNAAIRRRIVDLIEEMADQAEERT